MPVNTQKKKSWNPISAATTRIGTANEIPSNTTPRVRRTRQASHASGNRVVAAVCFASVATASVAPATACRRRIPKIMAAVNSGSMKTSKFAACASSGRNAVAAKRYMTPTATAVHPRRNRRRASIARSNAVNAWASTANTRTAASPSLPVTSNTAA